MSLPGADIFDTHLSVLEAEAIVTGSQIFLENIYAFKKQSATPDPVKDLLFTGTDHTGQEKYRIRILLEWDRVSGRILFRVQAFFSAKAYDLSGVVRSMFSNLRGTIRFLWYPTSLYIVYNNFFK